MYPDSLKTENSQKQNYHGKKRERLGIIKYLEQKERIETKNRAKEQE